MRTLNSLPIGSVFKWRGEEHYIVGKKLDSVFCLPKGNRGVHNEVHFSSATLVTPLYVPEPKPTSRAQELLDELSEPKCIGGRVINMDQFEIGRPLRRAVKYLLQKEIDNAKAD